MLSNLIHGLSAFIYFSCLIAVAKAFNTRLNTGGEREHACLVSDLREIAVSLTTKYNVSYEMFIQFHKIFLYCVECFFYHEEMLNYVKCLCCINRKDHVIFPFILLM